MKVINTRRDESLIQTAQGDFFVVRHSDPRTTRLTVHSVKRATHRDHGCYSHTDVNPFDCKKTLAKTFFAEFKGLFQGVAA
jgi:hypothetical protein